MESSDNWSKPSNKYLNHTFAAGVSFNNCSILSSIILLTYQPVPNEKHQSLKEVQREFILWYFKLGHASLQWIQILTFSWLKRYLRKQYFFHIQGPIIYGFSIKSVISRDCVWLENLYNSREGDVDLLKRFAIRKKRVNGPYHIDHAHKLQTHLEENLVSVFVETDFAEHVPGFIKIYMHVAVITGKKHAKHPSPEDWFKD